MLRLSSAACRILNVKQSDKIKYIVLRFWILYDFSHKLTKPVKTKHLLRPGYSTLMKNVNKYIPISKSSVDTGPHKNRLS